jgi:hypothetical protein
VSCPRWSAEAVAQVEARVRASLTAGGLVPSSIDVWCGEAGGLIVRVVAPHAELTNEVEVRSERVEDDVVWGVEALLEKLAETQAASSAAASAEAPPPGVPPPAALPPAVPEPKPEPEPEPTASRSATHPRQPEHTSEVYVTALAEAWDAWAFGAECGSSVGNDSWKLGLALGGRLVANEPGPFQLSEVSGSVRVVLALRRAAGIRLHLGVGPSVLIVAPSQGATANSNTAVSSAAVELALSRPFWSGSLGFSPSVGVRVFTAQRAVNVDGAEAFAVPLVAPQASLSLVYRP